MRVSSDPKDAYHMKSQSFLDGWGTIVDAKALVFQFPPTKETKGDRPAGSQDPPALFVSLSIQRTDADGVKEPSEPEEVLLSIARASKDTGELDQVHPGNCPNDDPEVDPEDCGAALGAEGNTLFAMKDGYQINDKTKWMTFTQSLTENGFKPAILQRTFFPDLIGLHAFFQTIAKTKQAGEKFDSSVFVVKQIKKFPYEKSAAPAKSPAKKTAAAPASKVNGAAPVETPTPATAADGASNDPEQIATAVIENTLAPAKKGILLPDVKKLRMEALMAMTKHKPAIPNEHKKAVMETFTPEWLESIGVALDLYTVQADGKVQFA